MKQSFPADTNRLRQFNIQGQMALLFLLRAHILFNLNSAAL